MELNLFPLLFRHNSCRNSSSNKSVACSECSASFQFPLMNNILNKLCSCSKDERGSVLCKLIVCFRGRGAHFVFVEKLPTLISCVARRLRTSEPSRRFLRRADWLFFPTDCAVLLRCGSAWVSEFWRVVAVCPLVSRLWSIQVEVMLLSYFLCDCGCKTGNHERRQQSHKPDGLLSNEFSFLVCLHGHAGELQGWKSGTP